MSGTRADDPPDATPGSDFSDSSLQALRDGVAAYFRRPMFVSILFVIVERIASRMSIHAGIHNATIAFPVRRFLLDQMDAVRGLSRFLRGRQMRELTSEQEELLLGSPLLAVVKTAFVVILLAVWIYSRREYESRPRE